MSIKQTLRDLFYTLFCMLPIQQNLITFESYAGRSVACNPKAIYQSLKEGEYPYRYKWFINRDVVNKTNNIVNMDEIVIKGTMKWLYYTAVSKQWIKNTGNYGGLKKRKKQIYINTWHSASVLKKQGYDVEDTPESQRIPLATVKDWDWYAAGSEEKARVLSSSLGYKGKIVVPGMPRTDAIINHTTKQADDIKEKIGVPADKKVIFYAPTFRDDDLKGENNTHIINNIAIPEGCILLVRFHYLNHSDLYFKEGILDVSDYPDINDLYIISDLLISDYSSTIFDFINLQRPILLYAYDLEKYKSQRGFYFDYENEMPGPIVRDSRELNSVLLNWHTIEFAYRDRIQAFYYKYCSMNDGHATERFISWLINLEH